MRLVSVVAAFAAVALLQAGQATAYPHFQLSSGTPRCNQCHVAPAGGGLLTAWGRAESGDLLSLGGDGAFLHGAIALPDWLALGGDLRLAALANDTDSSEGAELAVFPMQADLAARVSAGAVSLVTSAGLRGRVRSGSPTSPDSGASEVDGSSALSYLVSREHYLYWQPRPTGAYARAGRFYAPYGLRLADHTAYIRRYLGTNLLEETYGLGGGVVQKQWELHLSAYVSDMLRGAARDEVGGAALFELHGRHAAAGLSARAGVAATDTRLQAGVHGKLLVEPSLLVMAEIDGVSQSFDAGPSRWQLAGYAGPVWLPTRGLSVGAAYEIFDEDVAVSEVTRHAAGLWTSWLPWAHVEVMLSGRAQRIGTSDRALTALLQLHYYP
jgi:hypothetical protein